MQVGPERLAHLIHVLAGIEAEPNPSLILGATDQSPYAMAQLYQFLASGGEIQPLHAVRGVLDPDGKLLKRYDKRRHRRRKAIRSPPTWSRVALQQVVSPRGTGRQLLADGLGRLSPAGKTGTSNDGRDSWFAGYTGDHLAVVWMGNDQNEQTGLYGATGAMRVWSGLFSRLPSAPIAPEDPAVLQERAEAALLQGDYVQRRCAGAAAPGNCRVAGRAAVPAALGHDRTGRAWRRGQAAECRLGQASRSATCTVPGLEADVRRSGRRQRFDRRSPDGPCQARNRALPMSQSSPRQPRSPQRGRRARRTRLDGFVARPTRSSA
jgi:membrane peptidoglycan carboxypeptidase